MRRYSKPSLFQKMAWRRWGAKPLTESMLIYCQFNHWECISVKNVNRSSNIFIKENEFKYVVWEMSTILSLLQCALLFWHAQRFQKGNNSLCFVTVNLNNLWRFSVGKSNKCKKTYYIKLACWPGSLTPLCLISKFNFGTLFWSEVCIGI